ncbi:MAG: STAS/SEC14 domain-containing protein [Candidatus Levyibacteriota bacterium]
MIELLSNLPGNTVGVAASGHVSASDYETVLLPAVEAALEKHGKVRLLYELGSDFTGFTPGAMWEDVKLGLGHLTAWERVAVVTDVSWVANATRMFSIVMPCPVRVFPVSDRSRAEAWIAA